MPSPWRERGLRCPLQVSSCAQIQRCRTARLASGGYAPDRVLEFRARLDVFALLRAGALVGGAITRWGFDSGLLLRLTFHPPNLIVEHGSQRQQVAVSWYSPCPPIVRPHLHCPTCGRGCYALHEVGGIFTCRIAPLDYAYRQFSREWDRTVDGSPNRPDDMVWGLMRLSKVITQIPIA